MERAARSEFSERAANFFRLVAVRILSLVEVILRSVLDFFDLAVERSRRCWPQAAGGVDALNECDVAEHT